MPVRRGIAVDVSTDYREALPAAADHGADFVELAMEGPHDPERVHEEAGEMNALAEAEGIDVVLDLPFRLDLASPHDEVRRAARRTYERSIEAATAVGAETGVLRARTDAYRPAYDDDDLREEFVEQVLDLDSYASHAGLDLCVQNRGGDLFDLDRGFPRLFENEVSMCLDTGRAHRTGLDGLDQAKLLVERGELVSHLHLTDVDEGGRPVPLGTGVVDFERLLDPVGDAWSGSVAVVGFDGRLDPARGLEAVDGLERRSVPDP